MQDAVPHSCGLPSKLPQATTRFLPGYSIRQEKCQKCSMGGSALAASTGCKVGRSARKL